MFSHHWPILLWVWNLYQAYFSLINCLCNISLLFQVVVGPCKSGCFLCIGMTLAILRIERNCPVEKDIKDRVFQIALRSGRFPPPFPPLPPPKKRGWGWGILLQENFLLGSKNLSRSDFDHSDLFKAKNNML